MCHLLQAKNTMNWVCNTRANFWIHKEKGNEYLMPTSGREYYLYRKAKITFSQGSDIVSHIHREIVAINEDGKFFGEGNVLKKRKEYLNNVLNDVWANAHLPYCSQK